MSSEPLTLSQIAQKLVDGLKPYYESAPYYALGSGLLGGLASYTAGKTQAASGENALSTLLRMHQQTRDDFEPWRTAGVNSLNRLTPLIKPGAQFNTNMLDPGAQWRFDQGQKALDNRLRAQGKYYSGTAIKAGQDYAQDWASTEFGNAYNRLAGLSGTGYAAAATPGNIAAEGKLNKSISDLSTGAGNARASGYVGALNNLNSGIGNAFNSSSEWNFLNRLAQSGR